MIVSSNCKCKWLDFAEGEGLSVADEDGDLKTLFPDCAQPKRHVPATNTRFHRIPTLAGLWLTPIR
jgi:hypothetical protein